MIRTATLDDLARILRVDPGAIQRALPDENLNRRIPLAVVADAFGCRVGKLRQALDGNDDLLKPVEAAATLGVCLATFANMKRASEITPAIFRYSPAAAHTVIRYSRNHMLHLKQHRDELKQQREKTRRAAA